MAAGPQSLRARLWAWGNQHLRIAVAGGGYVGLVTAAGLASLGHRVAVVEARRDRVEALQAARLPIREPGLEELWSRGMEDGLSVASRGEPVYANSQLILVCVGTPPEGDGTQDLSYVLGVCKEIGTALGASSYNTVVAMKSTVLPGTTEEIVGPFLEKTSGRRAGTDFGLAAVPEFLSQGSAVEDFLKPKRIVIGALDASSAEVLLAAHEDLPGERVVTDPRTAEMIKYASNAFLASRVSLSNEIGNLCKVLGIDSYRVLEAVGMDDRIGPKFLRPGVGFGGSCFSKDVQALAVQAERLGMIPRILQATVEINEEQPGRMVTLLKLRLGELKDRRVALLGLAFKPKTDDVRESRGLAVARLLVDAGAHVVAYDPQATDNARSVAPQLEYAGTAADALRGADACLITTEWPEFAELRDEFKAMRRPLVVDGRRALNPDGLGIDYEGLCW